jgi:hypothetical protein
VVTGTPPTHSLYNNSICVDESPYKKLVQSLAKQSRPQADGGNDEEDHLQSVTPVILKRGREAGGIHDSVFLVSDGVVTSISGAGSQRWQTQTKAYWVSPALLPALPHDPALAGSASPILAPITPSLSTMSLRTKGPVDTLLALGQEFGSLLSADGDELASFHLPDSPVGPPAFGDLDHDGYTDVVLHCRTQIVGLSIAPRTYRKTLGYLMGGLLLVLVAVVVGEAVATSGDGKLGARRRQKKARATD